MKKFLYFAVGAALLTGCSSDFDLAEGMGNAGGSNTIGFQMRTGNASRSTTGLQNSGHYNFGVFGYKENDKVNPIMADYLVGYFDAAKGYAPETGSTVEDQPGIADGQSYWMYEKMGYGQFTGTYAGETVNPGTPYASNNEGQYLRYWDKSANQTCFYAYAPYVNTGAKGKTVTYVDGTPKGTSTDTYVLTIPNGTIKHGFDDPSTYEFMYASAKVEKTNYGHDVSLKFNRLNAKVNIKFWEDIEGYSVRLIDLTSDYGVAATPSIKDGTSNKYGYKHGAIYVANGAKIQFNENAVFQSLKQYEGVTTQKPLSFKSPTAPAIGESRVLATSSPSTYYAIPKGSDAGVLPNGAIHYTDAGTLNTLLKETGLTFHVSYELISTTGEKITVTDATVHVPYNYCDWTANKHYTYIFRITKNSNGSTATTTPDPDDPEVPTVNALYPIVFDNCVVEDWTTSDTEWDITDGNTPIPYHNITLSKYSVKAGTPITITGIADSDRQNNHSVDFTKIKVTKKGDTNALSIYDSGSKTITTTGLPAGVYTVTYTCPHYTGANTNHPQTWSVDFVVGNDYALTTEAGLTEVGLGGTLLVNPTKDNNPIKVGATALYIEYPDKINGQTVDKDKVKVVTNERTDDYKNQIVVASDATPGTYNLCFKTEYATDGGNVIQVTVAKTPIVVRDYQPTLSTYLVKLGASPVDVQVITPAIVLPVTEEVTKVEFLPDPTQTTGISKSGKTITVANTAKEGTHRVTYIVNKGRTSEVVETVDFEVENTYKLTMTKTTISRDLDRDNDKTIGSDYIFVKTFKNGVAVTSDSDTDLPLKVMDGSTDVTSLFQITKDAGKNRYVLKVKKTAEVNKVYTLVYTGQTTPVTRTATMEFTVQN